MSDALDGAKKIHCSIKIVGLDERFLGYVAHHRYFRVDDTDEVRFYYVNWLCNALTCGYYLGWLAISDDTEIVGGVGLVLMDWGPTRTDLNPIRGRIVNMYVEPSRRRQGIGRSLLAAALDAAKSRGICTLSLGATGESYSLYSSFGFKFSETEMSFRDELCDSKIRDAPGGQ